MVSYVLREWYVMSCVSLYHLAGGFSLGFPAILGPAITGNNTDIRATEEEITWFAGSYGMTGAIGYLILPPLMQMYGRRFTSVLIGLITFIGSVFIAMASDVTILIAGRAIQGFALCGLHIGCIVVAEYTHPKRRGFFIAHKIAWACVGELMCHALGAVLTWRQIAWIGAAPSALATVGTMKWPESPAWYAYKERYAECTDAFEWLRGNDSYSKMELRELILAQKELKKMKKEAYGDSFLGPLNAFRSKKFLKPLLIMTASSILFQAAGGYFLAAYITHIMLILTGDLSRAYYYTLLYDIVKTSAMFMCTVVVRYFDRRTVLFLTGSLAFLLLGSLCVFDYLKGIGISVFAWLTPSLLILYIFVSSLGMLPISVVLKGELFPLEYRGMGTCFIGILFSLTSIATLKTLPRMLIILDVHGTFGFYLVICILMLVIMYFVLPETKDRTLQSIEMNLIDIKLKFDNDEDSLEVTKILDKQTMTEAN